MVTDVWMSTNVCPGASSGLRLACTVADAVPVPRVSLLVASITTVWLAGSFSVNSAVPA